METQSTKKVYAAICKVMHELSKVGIQKNQENSIQKYKFRGIDDIYNELSKKLSEANLVILPRIISKTESERKVENGTKTTHWKHVSVEVEYDIVSAEDGSIHTVRTIGEAMDNSDKATNKAMSAAYKYMAFQTFCIPTEGDNDADSQSPELGEKVEAPITITDVEVDQMIENLNKCTTDENLRTVYSDYYMKLKHSNNTHALARLCTAKDQVKDRITKEAA